MDLVAEFNAACACAFNSWVTVVRQSTHVPNTSKSKARGGVGNAMVMFVQRFVGGGRGVGDVKSLRTGRGSMMTMYAIGFGITTG
jgi:hypothetical protein